MAENDLVKRTQAAGRRSAGHVCIDDETRWHRAQLAQDVGFDPHAPKAQWHDPQDGVPSAVRRLALLTFLLAIAGLGGAGWVMWHDGSLTKWIERPSSSFKLPGKSWSLPKDAAAAIDQAINEPAPPPQWADPYEAPAPAPAALEDADAGSEEGTES